MNRRTFLRRLILGTAALTLSAKLRLDPTPTAPAPAELVPKRPRYEWITGPVLTVPTAKMVIDFTNWDRSAPPIKEGPMERVCYGQLIDWEDTVGHGDNEFVKIIQWAKRCPVDQTEAEAFAAKYRDMWPTSARHDGEFKMQRISTFRHQLTAPIQGPSLPVDASYEEGLIEYEDEYQVIR